MPSIIEADDILRYAFRDGHYARKPYTEDNYVPGQYTRIIKAEDAKCKFCGSKAKYYYTPNNDEMMFACEKHKKELTNEENETEKAYDEALHSRKGNAQYTGRSDYLFVGH